MNELTFTIVSLILQLDYSHKSLKHVFDTLDPQREGKVTINQLRQALRSDNGIDLWITEPQI